MQTRDTTLNQHLAVVGQWTDYPKVVIYQNNKLHNQFVHEHFASRRTTIDETVRIDEVAGIREYLKTLLKNRVYFLLERPDSYDQCKALVDSVDKNEFNIFLLVV